MSLSTRSSQDDEGAETFQAWPIVKLPLEKGDSAKGNPTTLNLLKYIIGKKHRLYKALVGFSLLTTAIFSTVSYTTGTLLSNAQGGFVSLPAFVLYSLPFALGGITGIATWIFERPTKTNIKPDALEYLQSFFHQISNLKKASSKDGILPEASNQVAIFSKILIGNIFGRVMKRLPRAIFPLPILYLVHPLIGIAYTAYTVAYLRFSFVRSRNLGKLRSTEIESLATVGHAVGNSLKKIIPTKFNTNTDTKQVEDPTSEENKAHKDTCARAETYHTKTEMIKVAINALSTLSFASAGYVLFNNGAINATLFSSIIVYLGAASFSLHQLATSISNLVNSWGKTSGSLHTFRKEFEELQRGQTKTFSSTKTLEKPPKITISDLSIYVSEDIAILKDVNFEITAGETVSMIGGSGAGKTTLQEAIANLTGNTQQGTVLFDGEILSQKDIQRAGAYASDKGLGNDSVRDALRIPLPEITDKEIKGVLEHIGMGGTNPNTNTTNLSGGQYRRLAFIQAILKPTAKVFFFDEPTSELDKLSAQKIRNLLQGKCDSTEPLLIEAAKRLSEGTILATTHDEKLVSLSDKIIVVDNQKANLFTVEDANKTTCYKALFDRLPEGQVPKESTFHEYDGGPPRLSYFIDRNVSKQQKPYSPCRTAQEPTARARPT